MAYFVDMVFRQGIMFFRSLGALVFTYSIGYIDFVFMYGVKVLFIGNGGRLVLGLCIFILPRLMTS